MQVKIGWIGLGTMGQPMADQLLRADYELLVYNRTPQKAEKLISLGAKAVNNPKTLVEQADVIILMVSDDQATDVVFNGPKGLFEAIVKDKIFINMSTVSAGLAQKLATTCSEKGSFYIDAPVSGSVKQAETAQLVVMAGGEAAVFEKVKPILDKMAKLSLHVGKSGAGNHAKLAVNSLLALYTQGLAETILFANQNGINSADLLQVLNHAAIGNTFTKIKGEAILNDNFTAAFALKHMVKDLRLAKAEGLSTPLAQVALRSFEAAEKEHAEEDLIAIIKSL